MLLALDTATRVISLALHDGDRLIAESSWQTANHHSVELAPAIDAMLSRAGIEAAGLRAVAVALGPGSFTGLRIGLGLAKGMAIALGMALIGVPTLEILAAAQPPFDGTLIAVLQAGRGRVCAQRFCREGKAWVPQGEAAILDWKTLVESIGEDEPTLLSGEIDASGAARLAAASQAGRPITLAPPAQRLRRAGFLADCAWTRLNRGDTDDPYLLVPIYLHQPGVPHP